MNRQDLVKALAAHTEMERRHVDTLLKGFQDVITAVVAKGEAVSISGFAKFAKVERAARMGRNPATGETIRIKASKKVRVTPMKAFKDAVMTPSLAPKLARGVWPLEEARPAPAKRTPAKTTARRAPAKKASAKKAPAKKKAVSRTAKTTARKTTARKTTARKPATRKTTARKPAAKKTAARRR